MTVVEDPFVAVTSRYERAGVWAALVVAAGWHLITDLAVTIAGWKHFSPQFAVVGLWLGYTALLVAAGIVLLRGGGHGLTLPAVGIPLVLLGVAVAPAMTGTLITYYDWMWGASGWLALLLLWHRSMLSLLAFFAASTAISLTALITLGMTDRVSVARFIMVAYGVGVLQTAIFVGARILVQLALSAAKAEDARDQAATRARAAAAEQSERTHRYTLVRRVALDLLTGLASGRLNHADASTQRRIRMAATRLRILISESELVPNPLVRDLRASVKLAELRGVEVNFLPPLGTIPPVPTDARAALIEPHTHVLAAARRRVYRLTVVAAGNEVAVAVLADAAVKELPTARHPDVAISHEELASTGEEASLWVRTSWRGP